MRKLLLPLTTSLVMLAAPLTLTVSAPAQAANPNDTTCHMAFAMKTWSIIYKRAHGVGNITCENGQTMKVRLSSQGGGLTVGKSTIDDGHGKFSGVQDIRDVLGTYAAASGEAGIVDSGEGTVVTKGNVSLALGGTGHGWDIGVAFSGFTIKPYRR